MIIILADDLGFADLGCYGGEIETSNLDQLAERGTLYSQFRATPMCSTSRVALLAGMHLHAAGDMTYEHALPLPIALRRSGYRTMMVGKWHAGTPDPRSGKLFDRSFGFLGGMTDSFAGGRDWFLNGRPYSNFPKGFYSTKAFAERGAQFLEEAVDAEEPFFLYLAFNAPHHPCQAPQETVAKYVGKYDAGYQVIAERRRKRQIALGLTDADWQRSPPNAEVRRWEDLPAARRGVEAGRMAAYAAAVEEVDLAVGRVLQAVRDAGVADDTCVLFLSDNGGDYGNGGLRQDEHQVPWQPGSNPSSSNGWAYVKNTPFRLYKHACHEGGLSVPLIIRWPAWLRDRPGERDAASRHITDLYPTIIELARITRPDQIEGRSFAPLTGQSLLAKSPRGEEAHRPPIFEWYRHSNAWIDGRRKAVRLYGGPWQLYDLASDRGESTDLSSVEPDQLASMVEAWAMRAKSYGSPTPWREREEEPGWGAHRLQMVCPHLIDLYPNNSKVGQAEITSVRLTFESPVDFTGTEGKSLRLYSVADELNPVWSADPDESHPAQGTSRVEFSDLPQLEPDHQYFFLWDTGWVQVGGKPVGRLNDGAFWWRFRTPPGNLQETSSAETDSSFTSPETAER